MSSTPPPTIDSVAGDVAELKTAVQNLQAAVGQILQEIADLREIVVASTQPPSDPPDQPQDTG